MSQMPDIPDDRVVLFKAGICPYCVAAGRYLREVKGAEVHEVDLTGDLAARRELMGRSGQRTVPQIWIAGEHVGGYDDLRALDRSGGLDPLLARVSA